MQELQATVAATPAEHTLYQSVIPSSSVVYGDAPQPQARRDEKINIEIHASDPAQAELDLRALAMKRKQLLSDADARAARLRQLDRKIVAAYAELQARRRRAANSAVRYKKVSGRGDAFGVGRGFARALQHLVLVLWDVMA